MKTYISLLRGINVSGQKIIKMDALKRTYIEMNYKKVTPYLQSGNVVFQAEKKDLSFLGQAISKGILKNFGFEVHVIVLTIDNLKKIIENNPFNKKEDTSSLYITFLESVPANYNQSAISGRQEKGEEFVVTEQAVYLYCPNGYGRTKLNNNYIESILKTKATTRNWKTVNELLKKGKETEDGI